MKAVFLDLDGTVYSGGALIPSAVRAVEQLRDSGLKVRFLTNTDSKLPKTVVRDLEEMGLRVAEDEIFSPVRALEELLQERGNARCYFLVAPEIATYFDRFALQSGTADYVVVGDARDVFTYHSLDRAFRHLREGAELIALQTAPWAQRSDGVHLDTGSFVHLLEFASGKRARVLGKPSPQFFHLALRDVGCVPEDLIVVGDDVHADVAGGKKIGAYTVLVKTGKYRQEQDALGAEKADAVVDSIAEVPAWIQNM